MATTDTTGVSGAVTGGFGTGTPAGATETTSNPGFLSTLGNFVSSNAGLLEGLATGGVGLYQAGQATKQGNQAAGQIQAAVTPAQQTGAATFGQLTGGPAVGGPLGASITGQTTAAGELSGVAQQYGTGQLTSAQQTQIQQQVAAQKAAADQQLAQSGNMNSSARAAMHQQIDNNAAILTQQLINQNISMAEGAQTSVGTTYNNLLSAALAQESLGLTGTQAAVQTQLANDSQVGQYLQQIMSGIATQLGSASGGGAVAQQGGKQSVAQQAGGLIGSGLQNLFGGGQVDTSWMNSPATQADVTASLGTVQPMNLSQLTDASTSGWGGYTASNIDYTGYTGG